ncbi:MAG: hypothetical protein NPINA01_06090 [Nitrospinaceae bacterium]|nr:MAG: hypothetical protein NPINA01_06090 [Nitrospinaceae bacterium]
MREKKAFFTVLAIILMFTFSPVYAFAEVPAGDDDAAIEAMILNPGMASSCQNDFVIENLDQDEAELKLVLGNEEYIQDQIGGKEAKAYGLQNSLSSAMIKGKSVEQDDVAIIFNVGQNSKIRLHCVE